MFNLYNMKNELTIHQKKRKDKLLGRKKKKNLKEKHSQNFSRDSVYSVEV